MNIHYKPQHYNITTLQHYNSALFLVAEHGTWNAPLAEALMLATHSQKSEVKYLISFTKYVGYYVDNALKRTFR